MLFLRLLRHILPEFDFSLLPLPLSSQESPDLIWRQKIERETKKVLRFASITGLIFVIIWLTLLERPLRLTDALPFVILTISFILATIKMPYLAQTGGMYAILYVAGIALLGSQNTVGQASLFFFACILGASWLIGIRWAVILLLVSTLLLALFSCGFAAPFSFNCTVELTSATVLGNLAIFVLMVSLGLASFHGITIKVKEGIVHQRELSAALTQKTEDLAQALAKEQEINQIRTNLIKVVSHEFLTPMTVIKLSGTILERKYGMLTPAEVEKYHGQIDENLGRLTNLIRIVVTSKPQTNSELNELIEQVKDKNLTM